MLPYAIVFLLVGGNIACVQQNKRDIVISGKLHDSIGVSDGDYVFLFDAARKGVIIDSANVIDHHFKFVLKTDTALLPFKAIIKYWDTLSDRRKLQGIKLDTFFRYMRPIGFVNPFKERNYMSSFYVDYGFNIIQPSKMIAAGLYPHEVEGNDQNIPFYKGIRIHHTKGSDRMDEHAVEQNARLVKQFPRSYYLWQLLYQERGHFSLKDLQYLHDLFDAELQQHSLFQDYFKYVLSGYITNPALALAQLTMEDQHAKRKLVLETNGRNKLLIFWASWCLPCRKEIPTLKEVYTRRKDLEMISISIDDNYVDWQTALAMEQMPWKQFIVGKEASLVVDQLFKIRQIPSLFLVDSNSQIRMQLDGYSDKVVDSVFASDVLAFSQLGGWKGR